MSRTGAPGSRCQTRRSLNPYTPMKPNKPPAPIGLAVCFFLATVVTNGNAESETKPEIDTRMEKLEKLGKLPASQFSKIIDHSTSPNKRLAVAVGSKDGSKPVWHKTNHQGRVDVSEFSFVLEGDGSSANYLINVQDARVVRVLDGDYLGTRNFIQPCKLYSFMVTR